MNIEEILLQVAAYCDRDDLLAILSLNRYMANDKIVSRFLPRGLLSYQIPLSAHTLLSYYMKLKFFVGNLPMDDPCRYLYPFRDWLIFVKGVELEEFEFADAFTNSNNIGVSLFTRK
jgi:hypothetical protein